jgi:hypothetical protein
MSAYSTDQQQQPCEYLRVQVSTNDIKKSDPVIDELGRDGWQLVETVSTEAYLHMWFVRPGRRSGSQRPLAMLL